MTRRILVLFPDEWDRAAARDPRHRGRFEIHFEGFDLFRFPDNARLFTFDAHAFVDRMVRRYRGKVDAVVTTDEQFGPFLASLVAERLGCPYTPLQSILTIQHKYYAREAFQRIAPECNARFGLLRRGYEAGDVPLPFPFYVKPAKAAFSVLARRVDSFEELRRHTHFGWFERRIIERLVRPFADVMREHSSFSEHPFSMVAEEIVRGRQVTANGFARAGKVTLLGTVDSVMYPGTDQFQRFHYPSTLPAPQIRAVEDTARRLIEGLGFTHGVFNVELRVDSVSGEVRVIEVNPRAAGQFFDLFERVDGYSLFEVLLDLHAGEEPVVRRGAGRDRQAASFVLRDFSGEGLGRWPSAAEIHALQARHPEVHAMFYPKRGADLARELKWLGSYRYGIFNLGAPSLDELFGRFHRLCAEITFHPRLHSTPDVEALLAASGDD